MKKIQHNPIIIIFALATTFCVACGNKETKKPVVAKERQTINIDTTLKNRLEQFVNKPRCKGAFGLYVYDLTANQSVYGYNEHQAQPSASCMKLLSGVAGLRLLGTDYKYQSGVYTNGNLYGDTLKGDIGFKGELDPQLTATEVRDMAHIMRQRGIRHFTGKLYVDILLHDAIKAEEHWYPYDLTLSKFSILYRGEDFIVRTLRSAFRQEGFKFKNEQIVVAKLPKSSHCVFRLRRDISMVIRRMWKNSANTQATSLLYTIGHAYKPDATDMTQAGIDYMWQFTKNELKSHEKGIVIHDGCGLCTHDQLSPYFLCEVLRYGYADRNIRPMLERFLAVSGVDGTMRRWPYATKGKIRAKTGTLSHPYGISSLAGLVRTADGHMLCFAIMDSDMSVLDAHVLQRRLGEILTAK